MRIGYVAGYQGQMLIDKRNIKRNISLAGTQKIRLIVEALLSKKNEVIVYSHGVTSENSFKFYKGFSGDTIEKYANVYYADTVAIKGINIIVSAISMVVKFFKENSRRNADLVIIYNLSLPEVLIALYANWCKIPIILEYEDSAIYTRNGGLDARTLLRRMYIPYIKSIISGVFAASPELLDEIDVKEKMLLRGIIDTDDLEDKLVCSDKKEKIVLYCGTLAYSKGVDILISTWLKNPFPEGWRLHITGTGPMEDMLKEKCFGIKSIVFHGLMTRNELSELLIKAAICVNPHRISMNPGNVFPFKIIEYLASNCVVVTTPVGVFDDEMLDAIVITENDTEDGIYQGINNAIKMFGRKSDVGNKIRKIYSKKNVAILLDNFLKRIKGNSNTG